MDFNALDRPPKSDGELVKTSGLFALLGTFKTFDNELKPDFVGAGAQAKRRHSIQSERIDTQHAGTWTTRKPVEPAKIGAIRRLKAQLEVQVSLLSIIWATLK